MSICRSISLVLIIINLRIIVGVLLSLTDLCRAQTFYIYKVAKVVIVGQHENFKLTALQLVTPDFKNFNNSQELTVMSFIPTFGQNHLYQKVDY